MWQDILQILAIIGIVLLAVAMLVLLFACLILFVPIRYCIEADVDTETKHYLGKGKATWLLHILTVKASYPTPATVVVKLFGIPIKTISLNKTEESEESSDDTIKTAEAEESEEINVNTDETSVKPKATDESLPKREIKAEESSKTNRCKVKKTDNKQKWYQKIICTIRNLCAKIKEIWDTIQYYKEVLDENNKVQQEVLHDIDEIKNKGKEE